ncbi:MAG TPA: type II toxin-antitoxin system HipA family toxin [Hyphomonas sp.]|nr:toxin HipA [Hyphomonas sp.]HRI99677.1 type II toxin-antitoxin system HipA family toxin [Hyphomonas sp.]HRK67271.1 type II toxin-antitoxin system HipA family toxin [Hyphomonas sp.]
MARRSLAHRLVVYLNSRLVGRLERAASGAISFSYDEAWLAWQQAMPVSISLPLTGEVFRGAPVINVFENLLPDADQVRHHVAERLGAGGADAFSILTVAGRDCVGALQFLPEGVETGPAGEVRGDVLSEGEIADLIRRLRIAPLGLDPDDKDFRISIAGAQDKTALLKHEGLWKRPVGTTATTHILKPAIGVIHNEIDLTDSVQNEFVCLKLCAAFGLDVAEAAIEQFEDQLVLSVTRFDRLWTDDGRLLRLPQEDFCQALSVPSSQKYQRDGGPGARAILEQLKESDKPVEDRRAFLKAQIAFWLIGATDGHAKNFSIAHRPGGGFTLTPLYDILSAQPIVDTGRLRRNRFKMAMSAGDNNNTRMDEIQKRHFSQTADAAGLPRGTVDEICAELEVVIPSALEWAATLAGNVIPAALVDSIAQGIRSRHETLRLA